MESNSCLLNLEETENFGKHFAEDSTSEEIHSNVSSSLNVLDNMSLKRNEHVTVLPEISDGGEILIDNTEKSHDSKIIISACDVNRIKINNNPNKNDFENILKENNSSGIELETKIYSPADVYKPTSAIDNAHCKQKLENNSTNVKIRNDLSDEVSNNAITINLGKNVCNNLDQISEEDFPIKVKKTESFLEKITSFENETDKNAYIFNKQFESKIEDDQSSENDSPIKIKKRKLKSFQEIELSDDETEKNLENSYNSSDHHFKLNNEDNQLSESDSPIKFKKRKINCLFEETDTIAINTSNSIDEFTEVKPDNNSPVRKKRKKNFLEEVNNSSDISNTAVENLVADTDQITETNFLPDLNEKLSDNFLETEENVNSINEENDNHLPSNDELYEESMNENDFDGKDSDLRFESTIPSSSDKDVKSSNREIRGKELMRQALTLPYFHMPKPDFKEYMNKTDKILEEPLLQKMPNNIKKSETIKKVTLKPANNIVFEIEPPKMSKVEPFRQKVLSMMDKITNSKLDTSDKLGSKKNIPTPIGAERLSWKMKLLEDIAKKKEAALKERNEMLEEVMETNEEEEEVIEDSEIDDTAEDDVDVHFTDALNSVLSDKQNDVINSTNIETNSLEITAMHGDCSTAAMFCSSKSLESEKNISSSLPLCFSLPSFQPEGGFPDSNDNSSSNNFTISQVNVSFNDTELEKESSDFKEFKLPLELKESFLDESYSKRDEKIYHKVLTEEKLLVKEQNISGEIMTSDVLDICSGQFLDTVEVPKTPPLTNILSDEESDADVSDDDTGNLDINYESDSSSEDELNFKRKVLKKKVRPISPVDEESRLGEGIQSSSDKKEINSNFQFTKDMLSSSTEDHNSDTDDRNELNLNYDSEESLMAENKENGKQETTKAIQDYFDIEAELSGEEGSSDEEEGELDGEDVLAIDDTELPPNEELRDQIGSLHLKQLLDDDDRRIKEVKNHFLDEGELYSDATRQRKFNWTFNQAEAGDNNISSGSDNEDEINDSPFQQDKLKWKQENVDTKINNVIEPEPLEADFKIGVHKKLTSHIVAQRTVHPVNKRPRNSFLNEEDAKKSFKKIKLDLTDAQGTRATKNFVFVETNGPTRRKESKFKNTGDSSVFDII